MGKWTSRKWWAGLVGAAIPLINHIFDWNLSVETMILIIVPLVGFIIGESWFDGKLATNTLYTEYLMEKEDK